MQRSFFSMPRRYRRRSYRNRDKYSVEQTIIRTPLFSEWELLEPTETLAEIRQIAYSIIPPTDLQGMRKVKRFTLTFTSTNEAAGMYYALVYVPAGYAPQRIQLPQPGYAVQAYDANQFIISQGVLDFSGGPLRIRSPLARNLNSGDSVYLILAVPATGFASTSAILASVKYAITLQ